MRLKEKDYITVLLLFARNKNETKYSSRSCIFIYKQKDIDFENVFLIFL